MASRTSTRVTRSSTRKTSNPQELAIPRNRRQSVRVIDSSSENENDEKTNISQSARTQQTPRKVKATDDHTSLSSITPPKQRKVQVQMTPSSMLKKLTLTSPNKNTEPTSRKSLFSPEAGKTEKLDVKLNNQYKDARKALHSQFPVDMPGREKEIEEIKQFILNHLENETSGSIYISGTPGTGKTASLNLILEDQNIASQVQKIYINCTAIKSAASVYTRLNKELDIKVTGKSEKENLSAFEKYLKKKHKTILLVLDEIDQLETKNHSILYTIFEWPSRQDSRIILIGIANALDLTDRMLPRLQARCELKPKLLHFASYTKEQIVHIFTTRLKSAGVLEVFSPMALQMLAGKVASISGDVRRALDIGRRVIEMIDENKKEDILKSVENYTNELQKEVKKVDVKEVVSVLSNVYGTSQNLNDDNEESFPLQQKIIICSLLLMMKKAKNKDITIGKLHEVYSKVCSKRNLTAVDHAEFVGLCSLIETRGIIRVIGKKEPRMNKVTLEWNENEVSEVLRDKQLLSMILQDESCLRNS